MMIYDMGLLKHRIFGLFLNAFSTYQALKYKKNRIQQLMKRAKSEQTHQLAMIARIYRRTNTQPQNE